jgi:hypothetical protein
MSSKADLPTAHAVAMAMVAKHKMVAGHADAMFDKVSILNSH